MANYSIRTQRKEQKMKSKHWCMQKVGEVVVQVQENYAQVTIHVRGNTLDHKLSCKQYTT